MGPPEPTPSGPMRRYIWLSVHSANLLLMPKKPAMIIQMIAPGPPTLTAMATPAMFPKPIVADNALANAWKWESSPGSSGSS